MSGDLDRSPIITVVGATATGKSDLALDLAEHLGGEIINTDSMQFYRGMDIGTAKLPVADRRGIPHHLIDILDVTAEANVQDFQQQARAAIAAIRSRGHRPILVGGSGLYVRAAVDHMEFPGTDPAVRARLEEEVAADRWTMHRRLGELDPVAAGRITVTGSTSGTGFTVTIDLPKTCAGLPTTQPRPPHWVTGPVVETDGAAPAGDTTSLFAGAGLLAAGGLTAAAGLRARAKNRR